MSIPNSNKDEFNPMLRVEMLREDSLPYYNISSASPAKTLCISGQTLNQSASGGLPLKFRLPTACCLAIALIVEK